MKKSTIALGIILIIIGTNLWSGILYLIPYWSYVMPALLILSGLWIFKISRKINPDGSKKTNLFLLLLGLIIMALGIIDILAALEVETPFVGDYLTEGSSALIISAIGAIIILIGLVQKGWEGAKWGYGKYKAGQDAKQQREIQEETMRERQRQSNTQARSRIIAQEDRAAVEKARQIDAQIRAIDAQIRNLQSTGNPKATPKINSYLRERGILADKLKKIIGR